jgi:hypothetical protein
LTEAGRGLFAPEDWSFAEPPPSPKRHRRVTLSSLVLRRVMRSRDGAIDDHPG